LPCGLDLRNLGFECRPDFRIRKRRLNFRIYAGLLGLLRFFSGHMGASFIVKLTRRFRLRLLLGLCMGILQVLHEGRRQFSIWISSPYIVNDHSQLGRVVGILGGGLGSSLPGEVVAGPLQADSLVGRNRSSAASRIPPSSAL
jgi:hypothetical protein